MKTKGTWLPGLVLMAGLAIAGPSLAQTSSVNELNFELIAIDGNTLVIRDQNGTREVTVPSDFRFTVDGKSMAASDLKPGMKGTATIVSTTTLIPVVVTEVREAQVLRASDLSVTLREPDGSTRRFSQGELDKKGVEIVKDGRRVRLADLRRGDKLTATLVTSGAPTVLTEKEVQATLAEPEPAAGATQVAAASPAQASTPQTAPSPASAQPALAQATATQDAAQPAETSGMGPTGYVVLAMVVILAVVLALRTRKEA
ncbi:MAG TPA: hypothetical protein VLR71_17085 [Casimicrobiaceae bacterium]|nr:hypothetical protein [Casimicrobiaceae bacterium]